jgi:hypothetical protein
VSAAGRGDSRGEVPWELSGCGLGDVGGCCAVIGLLGIGLLGALDVGLEGSWLWLAVDWGGGLGEDARSGRLVDRGDAGAGWMRKTGINWVWAASTGWEDNGVVQSVNREAS